MKHLFISATTALILMSCGQAKQELKEPINPRDTSNVIACDSVTNNVYDKNGNEKYIRTLVCDSHYVSKAVNEEYQKQLELYEKAKAGK